MKRSMLTGLVAGIAVATAGGVAAYTYLGQNSETADRADHMDPQAIVETADKRESQPAARSVSQPAAQPAPVAVAEECWDEEVEVPVEARDDKAIAGTAAGAVIGGALAKKLGDDNGAVTAAGAAAGAFFGRKAQKQYQENKTTTTIERRCAPAGTR